MHSYFLQDPTATALRRITAIWYRLITQRERLFDYKNLCIAFAPGKFKCTSMTLLDFERLIPIVFEALAFCAGIATWNKYRHSIVQKMTIYLGLIVLFEITGNLMIRYKLKQENSFLFSYIVTRWNSFSTSGSFIKPLKRNGKSASPSFPLCCCSVPCCMKSCSSAPAISFISCRCLIQFATSYCCSSSSFTWLIL